MADRKSDFDWLGDYVAKDLASIPAEPDIGWWGGLSPSQLFGRAVGGKSSSSFISNWFWEADEANYAVNLDLPSALRNIRRPANVVSNSGDAERALQVSWLTGGVANTAASDMVYVSPDILNPETTRKPNWNRDELEDVLVAEALTEATFKRTVTPRVERAMASQNGALDDDEMERSYEEQKLIRTTRARLWQTVERLYAETQVVKDYPGFKGYFAKSRAYYTTKDAKGKLSKFLSEHENFAGMLKALEWELVHPDEKLRVSKRARSALDKAFERILTAETEDERAAAVKRTVSHFMEVWPHDVDETPGPGAAPPEPTPSPGGAAAADDRDDDRTRGGKRPDGAGRAYSDRNPEYWAENMSDLLGVLPDVGMPATPRDVEVRVEGEYEDLVCDAATGGSWDQMINHKAGTKVFSVKPSADSRATYREAVVRLGPQVRALRARLKFRSEEQKLTEHGLKRGRLDEGSLHKLCFSKQCGVDDPNLFEADEILAPPSVAFMLLVDESGSMSSENRYEKARDCAIVIANAVKGLPGVDVAIMGHTAQGGALMRTKHNDGVTLHQYLTPEQPEIESLGHVMPYSQNLDGYAIGQSVLKLQQWYPNHDAHILVHISDGEPAGNGYTGQPAINHVAAVCRASRQRGVHVVGVGVDNAFSNVEGKQMYGTGNFVVLPSSDAYHAVANVLVSAVHSRHSVG